MEKPQMMRKTGLMPPISRLIKKNKVISDKSDTNNGGISGVKFLSGSRINFFENMVYSLFNPNLLMTGCLNKAIAEKFAYLHIFDGLYYSVCS